MFDFHNPYEIEIAVRVCYGSSDPDHISIAQDLLQNASDRFPSTSVVRIHVFIFLVKYMFPFIIVKILQNVLLSSINW